MAYRWRSVISDCRKGTLQLTLKRLKWRFLFYLDCFGDTHIDFLLQTIFYYNTKTWLITFLVDEYHRKIFLKYFCNFFFYFFFFTNLSVGDIIHSLSLLEKQEHN